jgi:uncharacterized repeat protein (TIGR01451 family)
MPGKKLGMRRLVAIGTIGLLCVVALGVMAGGAGAVGATDVSLTKADTADPVTVGDTFGYVITVKNEGTMDAADVIVTDTLPSQVSYVSATPSQGTACQKSGSKITCDLGQVNTLASASVTITVTASKSGTASNTASLTFADDTNATNNVDTETTTISKKPATPKPPKHKGKLSCASPTIVGTAGDDVLQGTSHADSIVGLTGNDQIFGNGGGDVICAGAGFDLVVGGSGKDFVSGGANGDKLFGQDGGDTLKGKNGRDKLKGGKGDDLLNGGKGRDKCKGGAGRDAIRGCP